MSSNYEKGGREERERDVEGVYSELSQHFSSDRRRKKGNE